MQDANDLVILNNSYFFVYSMSGNMNQRVLACCQKIKLNMYDLHAFNNTYPNRALWFTMPFFCFEHLISLASM
jgi:hypothetical protein